MGLAYPTMAVPCQRDSAGHSASLLFALYFAAVRSVVVGGSSRHRIDSNIGKSDTEFAFGPEQVAMLETPIGHDVNFLEEKLGPLVAKPAVDLLLRCAKEFRVEVLDPEPMEPVLLAPGHDYENEPLR